MNRDHFWLTDRQFARIAPHLPTDSTVAQVEPTGPDGVPTGSRY